MLIQRFCIFSLGVMGLALTACQVPTGCTDGQTRCFQAKQKMIQPELNPHYQYIKLHINGRPAMVAQGATVRTFDREIAVYFSADRSVFKWSNGRLSAIISPHMTWQERNVSWIDWHKFNEQVSIDVLRDVEMKTTSVSTLHEKRQLTQTFPPKRHLFEGDASALVWVKEQQQAISHRSAVFHSEIWYALDPKQAYQPVYGQQCLSEQYCITWQVWGTHDE